MASAGLNTNKMDENIQIGQRYKVELTRTFSKKIGRKNKKVVMIAPPGKIFLRVICRQPTKEGVMIYSRDFPILLGTPQDHIDDLAEQMYLQIKKQFSL